MWEGDSKVDKNDLSDSSMKIARLHAKYLELLTHARLRLRKLESDFDKLKQKKWLWYEGRLDKAEMDELGWPYDPFSGGTKPLKGDKELFFKADIDLVEKTDLIAYQKEIVNALVDIMEAVKWRHQIVRNIIDWERFTSGA